MINDGYNETLVLDGVEIVYRPMLYEERSSLFKLAMEDEKSAQRTCKYELAKHVVLGEVDWDSHWNDVFREITGIQKDKEQMDDATNLREGVLLAKRHPAVATRDCESCRSWWYGDDGRILRTKDGVKRERVSVVACETQAGCPKGHHTNPLEMSEKNRKAYQHYLECSAIGRFPEDAIVRHNARLIKEVEEQWYWEKMEQLISRVHRGVV